MGNSLHSPNVDNYYLGTGVVSIKFATDSQYIDAGNATALTFTPKITLLDHFSSRSGHKTKDLSVVLQTEADLKITLEEYTARNMAMLLLGALTVTSTTHASISILTASAIRASVKFVGANDVGPQWTMEFPICDIVPSGAMDPINTGKFGDIQITANVLADDYGSFGVATCVFDGA
jgi:hypothetical protein